MRLVTRFVGMLLRTAGASLIVLGGLAICQDQEWSRSIDSGDGAMSKRQYAEAEADYRQALGVAEKHWKRDARVSAALIKLAESCNAQGKNEEAESLALRSISSLDEALKAHKPRDASDELQQVEVAATVADKAGDIFAHNHNYPQAEAA